MFCVQDVWTAILAEVARAYVTVTMRMCVSKKVGFVQACVPLAGMVQLAKMVSTCLLPSPTMLFTDLLVLVYFSYGSTVAGVAKQQSSPRTNSLHLLRVDICMLD